MNPSVVALSPPLLWKHFSMLSSIPRCSRNEDKVVAHLRGQATLWGLSHRSDEVGNLCITKPASVGHEGRPAVVLQAHVDMVCEQNRGRNHDFTCDPIELVVEDGWVHARETTLGASVLHFGRLATDPGGDCRQCRALPNPGPK